MFLKPLKLEDQFIYLSSNISSIESDFNIRMDCYWQVVDHMKVWSRREDFFSNCDHIVTNISLHYLDSNETLDKRAKWELHKSWKQQPFKSVAVWLLIFNLTNHLSKTSKACWELPEKLKRSRVLLWTPTHGHTSFGRPAITYIHQLCTNNRYSLEDLPVVMDERGKERRRGRERIKSSYDISSTWWYIYICIMVRVFVLETGFQS